MDSRRSPLLFALLAVLLLSGGAWFLLRTPADAPGPADLGPRDETPGETAGGADLLAGDAPEEVGARAVDTNPTEAPALPGAADLWLEGRVEAPPGSPEDPTLEVLVLADRAGHDSVQAALFGVTADGPFRDLDAATGDGRERLRRSIVGRAAVAEDGTFRVGLAGPRRQVFVTVVGRYLYLREARPVRFHGDEAEPALLTPELGAWVEGRVTVEDGDPGGARAVLSPTRTDLGPGMSGDRDRHSARVALREGRFSFRAVPADDVYEIGITGPSVPATPFELEPFAPGQHVELELEIGTGAVLRGLVTDGNGRPVRDARVVAWIPGKVFGFDDRPARWADTDGDGRFELPRVPVRELRLSADHPGFLETAKQPVEVPESRVLEGLALKLERPGRSITGRLRWPDGRPATAVAVEADFDMGFMAGPAAMGATRGARSDARTDEQGRFELGGLGSGPFVVSARVEEGDGVERRHTARADAVRPDSEIELVLRPGIGVRGRVVVGEGPTQEPVRSFTLVLARLQEGDMIRFHLDRRRQDVADEEGRFRVEDLTAGTWDLWVEGDGVLSPEALRVELPQADGEELLVTAVRTAHVLGRVVSARGEPVPGAEVGLAGSAGSTLQDRIDPAPFRPEATTGEDGAFELESLPGAVGLQARASGHGESAVLPLQLDPESRTEDVELRLTEGGTLAGEVLDDEGRPAAGRMVVANQLTDFQNRTVVTGADGTFRMENLKPGAWQVVSMDLSRSLGGVGEDGNIDVASMMKNMKMTQATLEEGQETWVTLGAAPENPVRVHGRVTHGDEPYTGAMVSFYPEGERLYERLVIANVDDDGRYEVELEQPGNYVVNVQVLPGGIGQQSTVEFAREVPAVEEFRIDLQIPLGRISGTVVGPDGRPAGGQRVTLTRDGVTRSDSIFGGQYAEVLSNSEGGFDLEGLRPGTYRVSAGGTSLWGGGAASALGRVTRGDVRVGEDEWVRGLTLELPEPGSVDVVVRDAAGTPVVGASVFLRDASGRMLEPFTMAMTDGQGKLAYRGVAPGEYTAAARSATLAAAECPPFRVGPGGSSDVVLTAEPGTVLWVKLLNGEGDPDRAEISVTDGEGREMTGMFGMQDLQTLYMEGAFSPTEYRIGPLPAGRYRVHVRMSGKEESKLVVLRGEAEKRLSVRVR